MRTGIEQYIPEATESITSTNSAKDLSDSLSAGIQKGNQKCVGAIITVESNSIRYAFGGANADQTTGHLASAGDKIVLNGYKEVETFNFASETADSHATLRVTIRF